jgi:DNA-binding MarR family transcriptional regulator
VTPSDEGLPLGEPLDFLRRIWAVEHRLERLSAGMEQRLGVTAPQRFVLRLIGRFPGVTAGRLAAELQVHPSSITGMLDRLGRRKLVVKRRDHRDRRRWFLGLTAAGREVQADARGTVERAVERTLAGLDGSKLQACREALELLARGLDEELASTAAPRVTAPGRPQPRREHRRRPLRQPPRSARA